MSEYLGVFEICTVVACPACESHVFMQLRTVSMYDVFERGEFGLDDPSWVCSDCDFINNSAPEIVAPLGLRFTCPHCQHLNLQVLERTVLERTGLGYDLTTACCFECEKEFGLKVVPKSSEVDLIQAHFTDMANPDLWDYVLYRL